MCEFNGRQDWYKYKNLTPCQINYYKNIYAKLTITKIYI